MKKTGLACILILTYSFCFGQVFHIDSLPEQGIVLNKAWKWHPGDDPAWVNPKYDDSSWEPIDPVQNLAEQNKLPQEGIGWLRIKLLVAPQLRSKQLGMRVFQAGATEIFLNGQLAIRNGKISPQNNLVQGGNVSTLSPIRLGADSVQVLAIRYAFSRERLVKMPLPFLRLRLMSFEAGEARRIFLERESQVDMFLVGVFLILGILQILLYATSTKLSTNLYFGIFLLAQCFIHISILLNRNPDLMPGSIVFTNQILFFDSQNILFFFFATISGLFYLLGIYRFFNQPKDVPFFVAGAFSLATLPVFLLANSKYSLVAFYTSEYLLSSIIPYLAIFRIGIIAIKQKKPGAALFTVSHTVLLLTFVLMAMSDVLPGLGFLADNIKFFLTDNANYFLLLSFLSLAVTISLLLSQESSAANKLLRKQLVDLDVLSKKSISQEQEKQQLLASQNERLEHQVMARTAELNQSLNHLRITQVQLIQKEKLASLGELTAGIAHEIQNPLNFVNNFSEVSMDLIEELGEGPFLKLAEPGKKYASEILSDLTSNLQKINFHGGRASSIVKGMLEHSRTGTGERQLTDLNALADEYLRLAYHGMRRSGDPAKDKSGTIDQFNCKLVTDFDPDLGMVDVVPQEIGRVLLNLYNNAFYAVKERGALGKGQGVDYQPAVWVSTKLLDNKVEIRVRDNGTGIPESVRAKIFQPFFTTKPTGEGTGLGLSLSYDIITKGHGGAITVESREGEGTEFVIALPVE
ncbi:ATP-binding protein [Dyadobacter sp. NIV53]|uniref:ATP-binding protein n=1 Tax=Dyadobacter sp. NIV53 TaxID=2861765 RepID=UPI001E3FE333|nr:ATP-binding protein [Dyadobacter sp. NIV53]